MGFVKELWIFALEVVLIHILNCITLTGGELQANYLSIVLDAQRHGAVHSAIHAGDDEFGDVLDEVFFDVLQVKSEPLVLSGGAVTSSYCARLGD